MADTWQRITALGRHQGCGGDISGRQWAWLHACLQRNRETDFGRRHNFSSITSIEAYRRQVPLATYETLSPWLQRIIAGEDNVLFAGLPVAFEQTGGSTAGVKMIPYSEASLADFRSALLPWLAQVVNGYDLKNGRAYWAISPAARGPPGRTRRRRCCGLPAPELR